MNTQHLPSAASQRLALARAAVLIIVAGLGGCGQVARVEVDRLSKALPPREDHPAVLTRLELLDVATRIARECREADSRFGDNPNRPFLKVANIAQQVAHELSLPPAPATGETPSVTAEPGGHPTFRLAYLYGRGLELRKAMGTISNNAQVAVQVLTPQQLQDPDAYKKKVDELNAIINRDGLRDRLDRANGALEATVQRISRAVEQSQYGGYIDNTVFRLDAGSTAWKEVGFGSDWVTLNSAALGANGETAVMFVQVSPAQFAPKGVSADPTEAVRAALTILNKALSVVNSFVPALMGAPALAIPVSSGTGNGTGATDAATPDAVVAGTAAELVQIKNSAAFKKLQTSFSTATDDEKAAVLNRLKAVLRAYKARGATTPVAGAGDVGAPTARTVPASADSSATR